MAVARITANGANSMPFQEGAMHRAEQGTGLTCGQWGKAIIYEKLARHVTQHNSHYSAMPRMHARVTLLIAKLSSIESTTI